jgi:DNA ligase-1
MTQFRELSDLLESVRRADGRLAKQALITSWMKSTQANDDDFANMVQWLVGRPFPDNCEKKLGVNGAILSEAICAAYEVTFDTLNPMLKKHGHHGLVAKMLAEQPGAGRNYPYQKLPKLTVQNISNALNKLTLGVNDKICFVKTLLELTSPEESIYLCSLILGKMPPGIGIGEAMILDCLSEAFSVDRTVIEQKYCLCGNLGLVACLARLDALEEIQVTPMHPIMPMLAISMRESKCESLDDALAKQSGSYAEIKYDGLRAQIHKIGDHVKIFSRNLEDKTEQFPDVVRAVRFSFPGVDCILDGEIVVVDENDKTLEFQRVLERIQRKKEIEAYAKKYPAVIKLFDLLWVDGDSCLEWEQHVRRGYLESLLDGKASDRCHMAECFTDMDNLMDFFDTAIADGQEGIIVKNKMAKYALTLNRSLDWIKVKMRLEPLDLEVINIKPGMGRLAGSIGAIELATASGDSVGWCASGLTDVTRKEIQDKVANCERVFVTVLYEEIQKSDNKYGLRFPILHSIRYDKVRADSNDRVEQIFKGQ